MTEDLAIRAKPKPVKRISRKVLLLGAGGLSMLLFAAFGFALQSPDYDAQAPAELYNVTSQAGSRHGSGPAQILRRT